jgi:hypothetical protein
MTVSRRWIIFVSIVAGGLLTAIVLDFVLREPLPVLAIVLAGIAYTRSSAPFLSTVTALHGVRSSVAVPLSQWVVPLAIIAGVNEALWALLHDGFGRALAVLVVVYFADVVVGWTIRQQAQYWHRPRRAPASGVVVDVEVGEPVDGQVRT